MSNKRILTSVLSSQFGNLRGEPNELVRQGEEVVVWAYYPINRTAQPVLRHRQCCEKAAIYHFINVYFKDFSIISRFLNSASSHGK